MPPLIILAGPTASGKSVAAIALAESLGTEIVSADSMQVYKYFDIGTAKPSLEVQRGIVHHGIDILEPDQEFNAFEFKTLALQHVRDLLGRGKIPIIVGGTGLYLKVFTEDFECAVQVSPEIRENVKSDIEKNGILNMYAELSRIDPVSVKKILPTDPLRIARALAVYRQTGKPFSSHHAENGPSTREFQPLFFILQWERKQLYRNIDSRIDSMLQRGWVDEAKGLLDRGLDKRLKPFRSIGYAQLVNYLDGNIPLERAVYEIKRETRHYAKRQITWFKKVPNAIALPVTPASMPSSIKEKILSCLPCWAALVLATVLFLPPFAARAEESPAFKEGLLFLQQANFDQAETRFTELRSSSSDLKENRRALYLLGLIHAERKQYDKAIETFKTALREFPEIEDYIRFDLARMYYESGRHPAALGEIDLLLKTFPNMRFFPQAAFMKAEILHGMGKTSDEIASISAVIRHISGKGSLFKSALPELIFKYAELLEASGKTLAAYRQIEKLLVKYPVHPATGKAVSLLDRLKQKPGFAIPLMEQSARDERMQNLLAQTRFEDTVREIEQFRNAGGILSGQLYVYLARAYKGLGRREETHKALSVFIRSFPKHPHLPEVKFMLARNLWNMDESEKSIEQLQSLIKNHPTDFWATKARFLLGRIYESLDKPALAIEQFSKLESLSKDEDLREKAAMHISFILYLAKDYTKAAKQFEKNIRRSPHGPFVETHMFWLAKTSEKAGQEEAARKTYRDLYAAYPFTYYGAQAGLKLAAQNTGNADSPGNPVVPVSLESEAPADPAPKADLSWKNRLLYNRVEEMIAMQLPENAHFEIRKIERESKKNYQGIRRLALLYINAGAYADAYRLLELYKNYKSKKREKELPVEFWKMFYPLAYRESVETHAKNYDLDPFRINGIIRQESFFDKKSLSRAGAIGLMQIMPETGERFSRDEADLETSFKAETLFDSDTNILTGVKYLSELYNRYAGNWIHILICYNAGPAALEEWLQRFGYIEDTDVFVEMIPYPETQDFVRNVLRNYGVYWSLYARSPASATTPAAN